MKGWIKDIKDRVKNGEIRGIWWAYDIDEEDKRRWYIDYTLET